MIAPQLTLRQRFGLVFVGFTLLLVIGVGVWGLRTTTTALESELNDKLLWMAGSTAAASLPGQDFVFLRPGDERDPLWQLLQLRLQSFLPFVEQAYVFHRDGYALVSTLPAAELPIGTPLAFLFAFPGALEQAWAEGQATTELFQGDDGTLYKYAFRRLDNAPAMLALLVKADFLDPVIDLRNAILLSSFLAAILATLLAYLLAAGVSRPLERLSLAALRIQRGRWDRPVAEEKGAEVGRLSRAMERMRLGIIQRDEQLRLMLAQVAHEIRNPLGGLELFASAAMEANEVEERRRLLSRIRKEVSSLNDIIESFLSFARPLEPDIQLHDVRQPLEEAADLVRPELERRGGSLLVTLPTEPLMGRADPDDVKRVALNLLRNAAQAGDRVWLSAAPERGEVRFSVLDDGPGIPTEMRENIFHAFVTDKQQGAGLGLAIVQRLVEGNMGRIVLAAPQDPPLTHEGDGTGARFRVYLQGAEDLIYDQG
jgi:signal transduction histidine kinase